MGRGRVRAACLVPAVLSLLLVLASACGSVPSLGQVSGSGTPQTKQFAYKGFTALRVDNTFTATVTRGDAFAVTVTVDDNLVKHLRVELEGDTLHIGLDPNMRYQNASLRAAVTMPRLRGLELSGASRADVDGFASGDALDLTASGSSIISLTGVRAGDVSLDVSGASRISGGLKGQAISGEVSGGALVSLEGSGASAQLDASGGAQLDLAGLPLRDADLQLSGGARASVRVSGTLKVEASGGAHLDYYGSPANVDSQTSGGAQVRRAGD